MRGPKAIYSTWGLHDELGDHVHLTEALATAAFERLLDWRDRFGVETDVFHLDCFWFDPERGFDHFHPTYWPRGFEPLRERIIAAGMVPGLWYSTNGSWLKPAAWSGSLSSNGWHHSLVEGPFADAFEASLIRAATEWGVRLFKFDFASFESALAGTTDATEVHYQRSFARFVRMLERLRGACPEVEIITHCGFARGRFDEPPPLGGTTLPPAVDASLLGVVDRVFSADPHVFDVPRTDLTRNVDLHQDRQVWHMHQAGIPLSRIEDHGVVMATTNTGHYRGRTGFVRAHVAQLSRGGRRDMFYGDPRGLTDSDVLAMKRMRGLFFDAWRRGLECRFVGAGEPGRYGWHGWVTGGGHRGLAYLVNVTDHAMRVRLPVVSLLEARTLFYDGAGRPAVQAQHDLLTVELPPESAVLVGLGEYTEPVWGEAVVTNDPPGLAASRLLEVQWRYGAEGIRGRVSGLRAGERLRVTVEVDEAKRGEVAVGPLRIGRQDTKSPDATMEPATASLVRVSVRQAGRELPAVRRVPEVPVWSGISWVMAEFDVMGDVEVEVTSALEPRRRLTVTATAVR